MFPELELQNTPNISQLLEYYIDHYPAYHYLRDRYYGPLLIKVMANTVQEEEVFNSWFKEFFCYLKVKLAAVPELMLIHGKKNASTSSAKSSKSNNSQLSDFCLEIKGPTNIINNLVFSTINNDVQLRCHKNKHMKTFNNEGALNALLNYPFIEVELNIGSTAGTSLAITRTCKCEYNRFIVNKYTSLHKKVIEMTTPDKRKLNSKMDARIRSIELVEAKESVVYTHGFINEYIKTLMELIDLSSDKVSEMRKRELKLILNEFLSDIAEMNLYNRCVIATNTSVQYSIGKTIYERYRYVKKSDINFIEILTPMITLHFKEFNPLFAVDGQSQLYFKQLKMFRLTLSKFEEVILNENTLKFTCTICLKYFIDSASIIEHFQKEHEPEVNVVCEKCELSLEVATLAANRWSHLCFE